MYENIRKHLSFHNYLILSRLKIKVFVFWTELPLLTLFKQITGLPMGCSLSGVMAILFMDTIEKAALRSFGNIGMFRRYIDDCFALVRNEDEAKQLLEFLNNQHPNIKFEIEFPESGRTLSLLDFTTTFNISGFVDPFGWISFTEVSIKNDGGEYSDCLLKTNSTLICNEWPALRWRKGNKFQDAKLNRNPFSFIGRFERPNSFEKQENILIGNFNLSKN